MGVIQNWIQAEVYFKDEPKTDIHHRKVALRRDIARRRRTSPNYPEPEHASDSPPA
jgi:hypothetical protein